ncbi:hypothetical protein SISNIDRAFT_489222 [Sistotremastrum niveocremeum HHB9708]|uniref:Uncharacterized protein n=1 Tax=Sistotremastrum niveocremeum HHB9708 TaxID=1314777 RepID=A0A164QCT2_9AGAM|nr:hypothetical protein SISNIDRAFT_489222 [Sistotremastrum niveocremeum HHB9708]
MFTIRTAFTPTITRARARSLGLRAIATTSSRSKRPNSTSQGHVLDDRDTTAPHAAKDPHSQAATSGKDARSQRGGQDAASGSVEDASRASGSGNQESIGMKDQVGSQSASGGASKGDGEAEENHGGVVNTVKEKVAGNS